MKYFYKWLKNINKPIYQLPSEEVEYEVLKITAFINRPGSYRVYVVMKHNGHKLDFDISRWFLGKTKKEIIREEFNRVYSNLRRIEMDCCRS